MSPLSLSLSLHTVSDADRSVGRHDRGYRVFQCRCGVTISLSDWCDDKYDCPDGSDEECSWQSICAYDEAHRCSDSARCIPHSAMCDGYCHCPNGEDEADCYRGNNYSPYAATSSGDIVHDKSTQ